MELPILFNTEMVRAILEGRKTVTRRVIKNLDIDENDGIITLYQKNEDDAFCISPSPIEYAKKAMLHYSRYQPGDILYIRETWAFMNCTNCNGDCRRPENDPPCYDTQAIEYDDGDSISDGCFIYRAGCRTPERITWRPSIHMPKKAARIFLKVTDVRVQRLQDMSLDDFLKEGALIRPEAFNDPDNAYLQARNTFVNIWDSTVKKSDLNCYGWSANPWIWVIEFNRSEKPVNSESMR